MNKINYFPIIDGLRAIAVLSVILYHLKLNILGASVLPGGYLGVDIFFVISGYLITFILILEFEEKNTISIVKFYQRRIRRIIPVLILVIFFSIPFAWVFFIPKNFIDYTYSVLSSLGFFSNFYFYLTGASYGAENNLYKPFLHTWSLSIEEQFYIIYPIFFLLCIKYLKKFILIIFVLLFVISLFLANYLSRDHEVFNFYLLPTRGWELIFGCILAFIKNRYDFINKYLFKKVIINEFILIFGFILILYSIIFFDEISPHPSFFTLLPVLGTGIIIFFSTKNDIITKFLSNKYLIFVGVISYSLYLWHFPVLAFARVIEFDYSIYNKFILLFLIFLLSIFSFYLVEKPSRNIKYSFNIVFTLLIFFLTILVFFFSLALIQNGFKNRMPEILQKNNLFNEKIWLLTKAQDNRWCLGKLDGCIFNKSSNKKIYLVGDSLMAALAFDLKEKLVKDGYQVIMRTTPGCIYFPGFNLVSKNKLVNDPTKNCNVNYFDNLEKVFSSEKESLVIFGGRFPLFLSNKYFNNLEGGIEGFEKYNYNNKNKLQSSDSIDWQKRFVSSNHYKNIEESFKFSIDKIHTSNKIILIYPIPEVGFNPEKKFHNNFDKEDVFKFNKKTDNIIKKSYLSTSFKVYVDRTKSSFNMLDSIMGKNIYRIYPHTLFCNTILNNRCLINDDDNFFYEDETHPSLVGSKLINDLIIQTIKNFDKN